MFQYIHDGSDSQEDSLVLVARTVGLDWPEKDKTSIPATLEFNIIPVNDAIPRLVNNTGLTVWAGSSVLLTNTQLGAEDGDTEEQSLVFSISSPHCGMVSLTARPAYPVAKFSQKQLRAGQVLFTHTGQSEIKIYFWTESNKTFEFVIFSSVQTCRKEILTSWQKTDSFPFLTFSPVFSTNTIHRSPEVILTEAIINFMSFIFYL